LFERLELKGDILPELLQQLKQALHAGKLDEHIDNMCVETGSEGIRTVPQLDTKARLQIKLCTK
jgi:hypothetical protein